MNKENQQSKIKSILTQDIKYENVVKPIVFARKKIHQLGFINTFWLKIFAIIFMTIDHMAICLGLTYTDGRYFLSGLMTRDTYDMFRTIGRLAFPIFCYLIVEGLTYTKNVMNYIIRLFIFALLSQVPFSLMTKREPFVFQNNLNVYFTLALGLITIAVIDYFRKKQKKGEINKPIFFLISAVAIICTTTFADTIRTDYSGYGVLVIIIFYVFKDKPLLTLLALYIATYNMSSNLEMYALFSLIFIVLHNHQKGPSMKYFFYLYYPLHMLILYGISLAI